MLDWLMVLCAFTLILFVGLLLYRGVSGNYMTFGAVFTASISGPIIFFGLGWLVKLLFNPQTFGLTFYPLFFISGCVMILIIWKWPESEISLRQSIVAVFSVLFFASLTPIFVLGAAMAGISFILPALVVIIPIILLVWWISG
jgi:hypothetical protein